jgi:parallel beta helix pectate lyase-like protein
MTTNWNALTAGGKPCVTVSSGPTSSSGADYGSDTSGTSTNGIYEAIHGLPSAGGVVFLLPGTFSITSAIKIDRNNVSIEGSGMDVTIVEAGSAISTGIFGNDSNQRSMFSFRNFTVNGAGKANAGFYLGNSTSGNYIADVEIDSVHVTNTTEYGIQILGVVTNPNLRVRIHDCTVDNAAGNAGMGLGSLQYSVIENNVVNSCGRVGIDPDGCFDLLVAGNVCYNNSFGGIYCEDTSTNQPPTRITISGNVCVGNTGDGTVGIGITNGSGTTGKPATSCVVTGNVCSGNVSNDSSKNGRGIMLLFVQDSIVSSNICKNNDLGILLNSQQVSTTYYGCSGIVISGNRCFDDQGTPTQMHGLYVDSHTGTVSIVGNLFYGNSGSDVSGASNIGAGSIPSMSANYSVTVGHSSVMITLPPPSGLPSSTYVAIGTPNWGTTCYVSSKTTTTVTFTFGTAAPSGAEIDVVIVR